MALGVKQRHAWADVVLFLGCKEGIRAEGQGAHGPCGGV
jgi:hypothetical protein